MEDKLNFQTVKWHSKIYLKTLERRQRLRFRFFVANFEHISHLFRVFLLLAWNQ